MSYGPRSILYSSTLSRNATIVDPFPSSWIVNDSKVPIYPAFYPPPSNHTSCMVKDSPAVIASRISTCLVSRSIVAGYDEEAVKATCITVDRCCFVVHLWYFDAPSNEPETLGNANIPRNQRFTLVECVRTRGSGFSFHRSIRAIIRAVRGEESVEVDSRCLEKSGPLGYSRFALQQQDDEEERESIEYGNGLDARQLLLPVESVEQASASLDPTKEKVRNAAENVLVLLRKDRLVPQISGIEQLVSLTDPVTVGEETAIYVAKCILGHTLDMNDDINDIFNEIREKWILELVQQRRLPNERRSNEISASSDYDEDHSESFSKIDEDHVGKMRSMVLRVISNSLSNLSNSGTCSLEEILAVHSQIWTSENFMKSLIDDIKKGADRQVHEVYATRLASKHDAAVACRIIGRLVKHHQGLKQRLQMSSVSKHLEHAQTVGESCHAILAKEAETTFHLLTCYHG